MEERPVSSVLLFEHINLNVGAGRLDSMRAFFLDALGCLEDPRPAERGRAETLLWCNFGLSQFHLPVDPNPLAPPEELAAGVQCITDGEVELSIAPGGAVHAAQRLRNAGYVPDEASGEVRVAGPCCSVVLRELSEADACRAAAAIAGCRRHPPPRVAAPDAASTPLRLARITVPVPAGALAGVAAFWSDVMRARVERCAASGNASAAGADDDVVVVSDSPDGPQRIVFCGGLRAGAPEAGWHVALYTNDFRGVFDRALAAGLVWDNVRFSDRGGTWELATENRQFRTKHLGAGGPVLELEIRDLTHPSCPL